MELPKLTFWVRKPLDIVIYHFRNSNATQCSYSFKLAFGMIGQMLDYKLAEAGGFYVESPTQKLKPTQRCARCWELTPKTLADRTHICSNPNCNHVEDRDVNAAQVNITWARGQELSSLHAESPSSTDCGSMKQLGALKREKLLAQRSSQE